VVDLGHTRYLSGREAPGDAAVSANEDVPDASLAPGHVSLGYSQ
jgi:hypothetical protein